MKNKIGYIEGTSHIKDTGKADYFQEHTFDFTYPDAQKSAIIGYYRQGATNEEISCITDLTVYEIRRIIDTYLKANP